MAQIIDALEELEIVGENSIRVRGLHHDTTVVGSIKLAIEEVLVPSNGDLDV